MDENSELRTPRENIIMQVGKFNTPGWLLDMIRNGGFCNRTPDTFALKDGGLYKRPHLQTL